MRRAAPLLRQHVSSVLRRARSFALLGALAAACSVYTSDLLEVTTGNATGGDNANAGRSGSTSGASSDGGKGVAETPNEGGEGGAGDPEASDAGAAGAPGSIGGGAGGGMSGGGSSDPGGTGGTAVNGGSSGTGGTAPVGSGELIDDFEDNDLTLAPVDGGVWYLVGDGTTGTVGPYPLACTPLSAPSAELGGFAMHITATGFTGSGSLLGADLRDKKKVFDASDFTGISFWAKVGTGKNTKHRVQLTDATTDPAGAVCDSSASAVDSKKCGNHFGVDQTLTTSWAQYTITFAKMTQQGSWGQRAPALNKSALYGIQVTAKANLNVDLWLDEVEFF